MGGGLEDTLAQRSLQDMIARAKQELGMAAGHNGAPAMGSSSDHAAAPPVALAPLPTATAAHGSGSGTLTGAGGGKAEALRGASAVPARPALQQQQRPPGRRSEEVGGAGARAKPRRRRAKRKSSSQGRGERRASQGSSGSGLSMNDLVFGYGGVG